MPLIILGILVVIALTVYLFITDHPERFIRKKAKDATKENDQEKPSVIYLPKDLEKEKRKRKIKMGKK